MTGVMKEKLVDLLIARGLASYKLDELAAEVRVYHRALHRRNLLRLDRRHQGADVKRYPEGTEQSARESRRVCEDSIGEGVFGCGSPQ